MWSSGHRQPVIVCSRLPSTHYLLKHCLSQTSQALPQPGGCRASRNLHFAPTLARATLHNLLVKTTTPKQPNGPPHTPLQRRFSPAMVATVHTLLPRKQFPAFLSPLRLSTHHHVNSLHLTLRVGMCVPSPLTPITHTHSHTHTLTESVSGPSLPAQATELPSTRHGRGSC